MTQIHQAAAVGFERGAADYERGRPGYPPAAIDLLATQLSLGPGRRVVDLAAGTGKLTRSLVALGADVTAVEPVDAMRAQLERALPGVPVLAGTAERLPLADGSVDAVVVAQAFHWFDVPRAAAEIRRVLVPAGGLGVIRNIWDRDVPWVDELQRLLREGEGHEPQHPSSEWRAELEATGLFQPTAEQAVPNPVRSDRAGFRARLASLSFVASMPPPARDALLDDAEALVEARGVVGPGGEIVTPYVTRVMWTHARP